METKICKCCNKERTLDYFGTRNTEKDRKHYYCKDCLKEKNKKSYDKRQEKILKQKREAYTKNPEKYKVRTSIWRKENRDICNQMTKNWIKNNPKRYAEIMKKAYKKYATNNKPKIAAKSARRRATIKQATPKWIKDNELYEFLINEIYELSNLRTVMLNTEHEVDHIIPLKGKQHPHSEQFVCGLHVPWNLQILTASENSIKSCYFWENMW